MIDWKRKGFASHPRRVEATGGEIVYRVGGGPLNLVIGSFFSPLKVDSVSEAESHFNIVLWHNRCYYLATYRVRAGTEMWIGPVAHGDHDTNTRHATQVYIERPIGRLTLVRDVEPIKQDVFVSPRTGHA